MDGRAKYGRIGMVGKVGEWGWVCGGTGFMSNGDVYSIPQLCSGFSDYLIYANVYAINVNAVKCLRIFRIWAVFWLVSAVFSRFRLYFQIFYGSDVNDVNI